MVQNTYVSFEQAKDLRKLGFPQYADEGIEHWYCDEDGGIDTNLIDDPICACSTQSMTQKWLREEKNLHIDVTVVSKDCYMFGISSIEKWQIDNSYYAKELLRKSNYTSYEQALSTAIAECIKLLKKK